jgi:isovaleryl-CoA dehydrogenase
MSQYNPISEISSVRKASREFATADLAIAAQQDNESQHLNLDLFQKAGKLGLLGLQIPTAFDGAEHGLLASVILYEELAAVDPGFALSCLAHSILFASSISVAGNDIQRAKYLPDSCQGRIVGGLAITESTGGTDAMNLKTYATKQGDTYIINGSKAWVTNASMEINRFGGRFLILARTSGEGPRGVSLFIVHQGLSGFMLGNPVENRLGMRSSPSAALIFENCIVPSANLVGGLGIGTKYLVKVLSMEKVCMAAIGIGIARACLVAMNKYAAERHSFGKPIRQYGQIQKYLAEGYASYQAGLALTYSIANNPNFALEDADAAKLYCSTMAKQIADSAIQVFGAKGYSNMLFVERFWRDSKLLEIGGGTLEAHQRNIVSALTRRTSF